MAHVNPAPIALPRRLLAEAIGTGLLVTVVVGSGIAAQRLSPGDTGLQLLENPNIVAVLVGRVDPDVRAGVRGAVQPRRHRRRLAARPSDRGIGGVHVAPYIGAQTVGAVAGALLANAMFDLPLVEISGTDRAGTGHGIGESVATAGLVALIFLLARTGLARPVRRGGRRLHRRRLLVHLVHLVREPRRHGRPGVHRHLRRDHPFVGSALCRRADHRRGNRCRACRHPVPRHEPQRSPRPGRSGE